MIGRTTLATLVVALLLATAGCTGFLPAPTERGVEQPTTGATETRTSHDTTAAQTAEGGEERANLTFVAENGTALANISAMVSDTHEERYTGLSDTESLGPNEGMLFVYQESGDHAYVMRDMDFPLDIIYVASNGTITEIHHAPLPPENTSESDLKLYRGTGQYVVEVNYNFTVEHNITEGDEVRIER